MEYEIAGADFFTLETREATIEANSSSDER
jgi:hypothetical protein